NVGVLHNRCGKQDQEEARRWMALSVAEPLAGAYPSVPQFMDALALAELNLGGTLLARGEPTGIDHMRRAAVLSERLTAAYPAPALFRIRDATIQRFLAMALHDAGNKYEAETISRAAVARHTKLAAAYSPVNEQLRLLARLRTYLGQRSYEKKNWEDALAEF